MTKQHTHSVESNSLLNDSILLVNSSQFSGRKINILQKLIANPDYLKTNKLNSIAEQPEDYQKAIELLTNLAETTPANWYIFYFRGIAHHQTGMYEKALSDFTECVTLAPDNPFAYIAQADTYMQIKAFDKAATCYSRSIELDPEISQAYLGRAEAYAQRKIRGGVLEDYTAAIKLDRKCAKAYLGRAKLNQYFGNLIDAEKDCTKAIKYAPELLETYHLRASIRMKWRYNEGIIEDLLQVIKHNPTDYDSTVQIAIAYLRLGEYEKTLHYCELAIVIQPDHPYAYHIRGIGKFGLGNYNGAIRDFKKSIRLGPKVYMNYECKKIVNDVIHSDVTLDREARSLKLKNMLPLYYSIFS